MKVSEKVKELRAARGWSQEQMAEKLGVSRQAITKWETGAGVPDIENLVSIAQLFGVTTDELIFGTVSEPPEDRSGRYASVTSVDVLAEKHYDIKVGCARSVVLRQTTAEKATVRLEADSIADLDRAFKVALDTEGRGFDIDVASTGIVADALARQQLDVTIELPGSLSADAEVELSADELRVEGARFDVEVGGKVSRVSLVDIECHVELDVPVDMEVWVDGMRGTLDVNQVGATSVVHVGSDTPFSASTRGRLGKRVLRFTRNGEPVDGPSPEELPTAEATLAIELSGARCELTVDSLS